MSEINTKKPADKKINKVPTKNNNVDTKSNVNTVKKDIYSNLL